MNNLSASLRTLAIYAVCLPVAIFLGYTVSNPLEMSTVVTYAVIAFALCLPLLMKWHHAILMLSWNMSMTMFFLPGRPTLAMVALVFSGCVFVLQRALDRKMRFIVVPQVTIPLVLLGCVVLMTAKLTGGIGFRSLGSEVYGGKHYMFLMFGILAYFVISARPIPPEKVRRYMGLFCIGSITTIISDFYSIAPSGAKFIFLFFPPSVTSLMGDMEVGTTRLAGAGGFATAVFLFMMCRYGIEGIFSKPLRAVIFIAGSSVGLLGGHRAFIVTLGLIFMIQFFLEGLHRTKWLVRFGSLAVIGSVFLVVFSSKLPFTLQRTISFLPFVEVGQDAVDSAQSTVEWRFKMWAGLARQIPQHLLLGKGYALTAEEFQGTTGTAWAFADIDPSQNGLALAGDYHNGWLSVILPFGIWGSIAVLWFLGAGGWVLVRNYRYGNPELQLYNTFLLAFFLELVLMFWGGALHTDMLNFGALVGLSVSLNRGVSKIAPQPVPERSPVDRRPLLARPAFGRSI
jgi:hypothetical protein